MKYHANPTNERSERQVNEATPPWRPVAQEKKADESASKTQELPNSAKVQTKFLQEPLRKHHPKRGPDFEKSLSKKNSPPGAKLGFFQRKSPPGFLWVGDARQKTKIFPSFLERISVLSSRYKILAKFRQNPKFEIALISRL